MNPHFRKGDKSKHGAGHLWVLADFNEDDHDDEVNGQGQVDAEDKDNNDVDEEDEAAKAVRSILQQQEAAVAAEQNAAASNRRKSSRAKKGQTSAASTNQSSSAARHQERLAAIAAVAAAQKEAREQIAAAKAKECINGLKRKNLEQQQQSLAGAKKATVEVQYIPTVKSGIMTQLRSYLRLDSSCRAALEIVSLTYFYSLYLTNLTFWVTTSSF